TSTVRTCDSARVRYKAAQVDWTKILLILWACLLVCWIPLIAVSLIVVGDSGTLDAYVFAVSVLTYPLAIIIVALFRRKAKWIAFAPCINITAALLAYYGHY